MYCQLDRLRRCLSPRIRRALDELPDTLDETYERTLLDIDEENWVFAHRLLQSIVVARRPLRVDELAEFLTFNFEEGGPTFHENWRPEDPRDTVLSTCSSLIAVVNVDGSPVVQFSHFSVKEYLTSNRIADGRVSRYFIPLEPAHVIVVQVCLSVLLQLDIHVTKQRVKDGGFPLASYAGRYWVDHAKFENVSSQVEDMINCLFEPGNPHFASWVWIYNLDIHGRLGQPMISETPSPPGATPLYYATLCDFHSVAEWLITTCSQDVNARGGYCQTPLYAASMVGSPKTAQVLLQHNAQVNLPGVYGLTPLHGASAFGHLEVSRVLLEYGADVTAVNTGENTPLYMASEKGHMEVAQLLLEHGADPNSRNIRSETPLNAALQEGHLALAQVLLKHGADPNAQGDDGKTLLHLASQWGDPKLAQRLLEVGANIHARDNKGRTALQIASGVRSPRHIKITELLLEHGADRT